MDNSVAGVLLAGGLSRRMGGGDKCLRILGSMTILDRIVARVRPQVTTLVLNANGDPARFASFGLPVLADPVAGHPGPLAGVLAGLDWAAAQGATHLSVLCTNANDAANALYSSLGMELVGQYHYRIKKDGKTP